MGLVEVGLLTLIPWVELRGSIPYGIASGINPLLVLIIAIIINTILFFPMYIGLSMFYKYIAHWGIAKKVIEKAKEKSRKYEKYETLGVMLFVAIPLPGSGVYMGTLISWLLGLRWEKALLSIFLGVIISGLFVFSLVHGILFIL